MTSKRTFVSVVIACGLQMAAVPGAEFPGAPSVPDARAAAASGESAAGEAAVRAIRALSKADPTAPSEHLAAMVREDLDRRLDEANRRSTAAWQQISDRPEWESFRDRCLTSLRDSLGSFPKPAERLDVHVTGQVAGAGYRIENLVFCSRPGLWVTANLYVPASPTGRMPGILICHSHHRPKEQAELQDMGMTWARAGCLVLVMDQLGHGERQQHPFRSESDYAKAFRVSRQDYYFRYDAGMQLHLAGESLIGWMAWDLMRGVDLLLARDDVDPRRILLLGAVAGGGDPATVTAALDPRIAAVVPFNFGGPQPETAYPLPEDAAARFHYAGSGSWESTRNLRRSAADGFLPWVLAGAIAPRVLGYAHEFSWDRDRDPVWQRLQQIYAWYEAGNRLFWVHGSGSVRSAAPDSTHCTNIGRLHRTMIHPAFERWFQIRVAPDDEYSAPIEPQRLRCMTPDALRRMQPRPLHELLGELAAERMDAARRQLETRSPEQRRAWLQEKWSALLGSSEPRGKPAVKVRESEPLPSAEAVVEHITLETEPGILMPLVLLRPAGADRRRPSPVVVAVSQAGSTAFLDERPAELARLLAGHIAICLPDLRGTGQTRSGSDRGQDSADTARSSTELMLGGTMAGARLRDLRSVMHYLRGRGDLESRRVALWGQSFAAANPAGTDFDVPRRVEGRPEQSEPLGGLLALFGALYEDDVAAVAIDGGLESFASVLASYQVLIPHDVVIPGALTAGDLSDLAASLAPRPLWITNAVDGLNRRVSAADLAGRYAAVTAAYAGTRPALTLAETDTTLADWFVLSLAQANGITRHHPE